MGYIYLLTNTFNNKQYVGQTMAKNITERWNTYRKLVQCSIGRYLYNAFLKHSVDSFKFQIICVCFDEDCNQYEEDYIKKFNTIVPNGYNLQSGGNNRRQHPESILKKTMTIRNSPNYEQYKKNISIRLTGKGNPNFGKKMSDEQKKKISDTIKRKKLSKDFKETSEETKKKISESLKKYFSGNQINNKGVSKLSKRVDKYSLDDEYLETYNSLSEAARSLGVTSQINITRCCSDKHTKYKTYKGFKWKFNVN